MHGTALTADRTETTLLDRLNGPWHETALRVFVVIVLAHWAEHLLQAFQIYGLGWRVPEARGLVGYFFPFLVSSELMHYGYAAVMLAGPTEALTATATYPVLGALLARPLLGQRLDRVGWLGVVATAAGATLIAVEAGSGVRNLIGIGVALVAAAAVALEGIVATRAMVGLDANTVMAGRELLSAVMFGLVVLAVPGAVTAVGGIVADTWLIVLIAGAGAIGGYSYAIWYRSIRKIGVARAMALNISYAMWGVLFAWIVLHAPPAPLAIAGCVVVSAGAVLTILSGRRGAERAAPAGPARSIRGVLLRGLLPRRLVVGGDLHHRR